MTGVKLNRVETTALCYFYNTWFHTLSSRGHYLAFETHIIRTMTASGASGTALICCHLTNHSHCWRWDELAYPSSLFDANHVVVTLPWAFVIGRTWSKTNGPQPFTVMHLTTLMCGVLIICCINKFTKFPEYNDLYRNQNNLLMSCYRE